MAFDRAGNLYIAEAGAIELPADTMVSPSTNHSSRILRIGPDRQVTAILDRLPFTHYATAGDIGATDVSVLDDTVFVLTGEGYDDGLSRAVLRLRPGAAPQRTADLLGFAFASTPIAEQLASGGVPSNPYAMVAAPDGNTLYVTDGASGTVLSITHDGQVRTFATVPGMPPLTGLAFGPDHRLYIAMLSALPLANGNGGIWVADAAGRIEPAVSGLTMPIDVAFDAAGAMYVLEFSVAQPSQPYIAHTGRLLRITADGAQVVVLERLNFPTAMLFSGQGDLYISAGGAFSAASEGAILRVPCRSLGSATACPP